MTSCTPTRKKHSECTIPLDEASIPYTPAPVTDWCLDSGYYNDGFCDSGCPQPDPDCGGGNIIEPEAPETEYLPVDNVGHAFTSAGAPSAGTRG